MNYEKYVKSFQDFPKQGVVYWDFTPLLDNPEAFKQAIRDIIQHFSGKGITKIAAIESKGFTIGSAIAYAMQKPLVLIRKPGLTPGETVSEEFVKEYGKGEYQIKKGAFQESDTVLIIYDIMAGPGATQAAISLVESAGAKVAGCAYVIELEYLNGREALANYDLFSLVKIKEKKYVHST